MTQENTTPAPEEQGAIATLKAAGFNGDDAAGLAEGWIESDDEDVILAAWQHLHDTGLAYRLQGWFGRTAQRLIEAGHISA